MYKKILLLVLISLSILTTYYILPTTVSAQVPAPLPSQLLVTPSIVRLDLAKDQPEAQITYKNLSKDTIELSFQAQNFTELEDGYKLSFLEGKDAQNYTYGLSSWIQFSTKSLVLDPGESENITIFIAKDKLSPGGHYATILAQVNPQEKNGKQVQVKSILASLVFVRTNTGKEQESALLPTFAIDHGDLFGIDFPSDIYFRFDNTGDTDLTPYGLAQMYDMSHALVGKGIVNEASAPTLPQSIRRYYVPIRNLQQFLFPGIYTATISLHFGVGQEKIIKTVIFFSQGSIPLIPTIVVLILSVAIFLYWRKHKTKKSSALK